MTVMTHAWEHSLLSLAHAETTEWPVGAAQDGLAISADLLERAYAYCDALTAAHSRSFYMASSLLPDEKKRAVRALYAFCRVTDDVVDRPAGDPTRGLEEWRAKALSPSPPIDDKVAIAWADARKRFAIPQHYAEQLISGVGRDLTQNRYETFEELAAYSYGVASTVGLMSMHIIGFTESQAIAYAVKLGVALQMTNILRDVAEDWRNGRIYLPQQELGAFGLSENDLTAGIVTNRWREFMRFQVGRNRQLYDEAWPGIGLLHAEGRFAIGAAAGLYQGILGDIERHEYDVFTRRAYISTPAKLGQLPSIWWRSQRAKPDRTALAHGNG